MAGATSTHRPRTDGARRSRASNSAWSSRSRALRRARCRTRPRGGRVASVAAGAAGAAGDERQRQRCRRRDCRVGRRLRVLVHEPRPSWAWPSSAARSKRIRRSTSRRRAPVARAGRSRRAPRRSASLRGAGRFDAVLVGAPEELSAADVDALACVRAASRRGGGARARSSPLGPIRCRSSPAVEFDEVLVERSRRGARVERGDPARQRTCRPASRIASGADVLAAVDDAACRPAVILSRSLGAGTVIFSGALDAWRFRGARTTGSVASGRSTMAEAALRAPAKAGGRDRASGRAARSRSEAERKDQADRVRQELPDRTRRAPVGARIVGHDGIEESIRLWPSAEAGLFEGTVKAPDGGLRTMCRSEALP